MPICDQWGRMSLTGGTTGFAVTAAISASDEALLDGTFWQPWCARVDGEAAVRTARHRRVSSGWAVRNGDEAAAEPPRGAGGGLDLEQAEVLVRSLTRWFSAGPTWLRTTSCVCAVFAAVMRCGRRRRGLGSIRQAIAELAGRGTTGRRASGRCCSGRLRLVMIRFTDVMARRRTTDRQARAPVRCAARARDERSDHDLDDARRRCWPPCRSCGALTSCARFSVTVRRGPWRADPLRIALRRERFRGCTRDVEEALAGVSTRRAVRGAAASQLRVG